MDEITVNQGDYGPMDTLALTVTDPDEIITSLAGLTIRLIVWDYPAVKVFDGLCVFDTDMTCHYIPIAADFAVPGIYKWKLELTDGTGRLSTIEGGRFVINPCATH
jgi:hypothetical protein